MAGSGGVPQVEVPYQGSILQGLSTEKGRDFYPGPSLSLSCAYLSQFPALLTALTFATVLLGFCQNLTTVSELAMTERVCPLGNLLGLRQDWGVFAPYPTRTDGWYVIPGTLQSGQQVDLMGAAVRNDYELSEGVSWEEPEDIRESLKNKYWRKYLEAIRDPDNEDLRKYLGRYVCREWNARHAGGQQLVDLQIVYMKVKTLPDYGRTPPEKVVLREHSCSQSSESTFNAMVSLAPSAWHSG